MNTWLKKRIKESRAKVKYRKIAIANILKSYFGLDMNKVVLDVGCGQPLGEISNYVAGFSKKVIGIDIDESGINEAKKNKQGNVQFLVANVENMPLNGSSVDIILCTEIIEHIKNPGIMLKEFRRVLKKDGLVYMTTPNKLWLNDPHYGVPFNHFLPGSLQKRYLLLAGRDPEYGKINLFTRPSLKRLLENSGFIFEDLTFEILSNMKNLEMKSGQGGKKLEKICRIIRRMPKPFQELAALFFPVFLIRLRLDKLYKGDGIP